VHGITELLTQDPEISKILTEMSIEYLNINYIPAQYRLLLHIMQASYVMHRTNTIMLQRAAAQIQQTQPAQPATPQPDKPVSLEKFVAVRAEQPDNVPDIDMDEVRKPAVVVKFDTEKYKDL
jgi:hypothetical protein